MKSFISGLIGGLAISLLFAGIMSENDDKIIKYEKGKANAWRSKYWEGNRQIALYDDEVKQLKKIIKKLTNEM
jgi:hypothetical protein